MSTTVRDIQDAVGAEFHIRREDLLGRDRNRDMTTARHVAMWLAARTTPLAYTAIGRLFAHRDHRTVMRAEQRIDALMAADPAFASRVRHIAILFECEMAA